MAKKAGKTKSKSKAAGKAKSKGALRGVAVAINELERIYGLRDGTKD